MLNEYIRILNFDDSVLKQQKLVSSYKAEVLDLKNLGPQARIWLDKKTKDCIQRQISSSSKNSPTFLGSGDFHHISSLLIGQFQEPISVIIFDNHPDWDILSPGIACGSWVNRVFEKRNVLKVVSLGSSCDDISTFWIQSGNLDSLKSDRMELYPYSHGLTKVFLRSVPENVSIKLRKGLFLKEIRWQEVKGHNIADFLLGIIKRLSVKQAYVSIDKDCLKSEYSMTNWEEGSFKLEDLLAMLKLLKKEMDIVGLDITGDYSHVKICGKVKKFCSYFDHPRDYSAKGIDSVSVDSINESTNIKIIEALRN